MTVLVAALAMLGGTDGAWNPQQIRIEVCVLKGDPLGSKAEGTVQTLAEPVLVAFGGHSAFFRAGGNAVTKKPNGDTKTKPFGVAIETLPIVYENGKVWVEVNVTYSEGRKGRGGLEVAEQQSRTTRFVTAGEKFRIRIAADSPESQTWAEITVTPEPRGK